MSMESIVWLAILAVLLIIEIATLGLTTIWFAGGALIAFLVAIFGGPLWLQIALFIIVSIVLLIFTRPIAAKYLNKGLTKTNVDSLPGQRGVVTERVDNLSGTGQVTVNGMPWTARTESDSQKIEEDSVVKVIKVEGVKLIVEQIKQ